MIEEILHMQNNKYEAIEREKIYFLRSINDIGKSVQ